MQKYICELLWNWNKHKNDVFEKYFIQSYNAQLFNFDDKILITFFFYQGTFIKIYI